jgi:hypothetical protein
MKLLLFILSLSFLLVTKDKFTSDSIIKHEVEILHPGISSVDKVHKTLYQNLGREGQQDQFFMEVETVVCGDSKCKIDIIKIYWDKFGFFQKIELPEGVNLEKGEGKHFDDHDYTKLQGILTNSENSLKEIYKEEVVGLETTEGVDAVSGATILVNTDDYVSGAVWTCYTLWHWAHGDIKDIIRNITGDALTQEEIISFLRDTSIELKVFAVEQCIRNSFFDAEVSEIILNQVKIADYQLNKLLLKYISSADDSQYCASMDKLLKVGNSQADLFIIKELLNTSNSNAMSIIENTLTNKPIENYPLFNQLVSVLEKKKIMSPYIQERLLNYLNNDNLLISRRAYWFLKQCDLTEGQIEKLDVFYKMNSGRM